MGNFFNLVVGTVLSLFKSGFFCSSGSEEGRGAFEALPVTLSVLTLWKRNFKDLQHVVQKTSFEVLNIEWWPHMTYKWCQPPSWISRFLHNVSKPPQMAQKESKSIKKAKFIYKSKRYVKTVIFLIKTGKFKVCKTSRSKCDCHENIKVLEQSNVIVDCHRIDFKKNPPNLEFIKLIPCF